MIKLSEKARRVLRTIYRGLGVAAVSFIFQACYGMPQDFGDRVTIHGYVKSKTTKAPIPGIKVSVGYNHSLSQTEGGYTEGGYFRIYIPREDYYTVTFEDIDGPENGGLFKPHTIENITTFEAESSLSVELEEEDAG